MPTAERGGFPTHWTVRGEGDRDAVLIHCSLAHQGAWKGVEERLAPYLRMTAFDIPGHGRSGDWDERGDYQAVTVAMAADLIEGEADLIGHSFGATVGLRLAIEQPMKVRSLTMIEPVFFTIVRGLDAPRIAEHHSEYNKVIAALDSGEPQTAARRFLGDWGVGTPWEDLPEKQRRYAVARIGQLLNIEHQIYRDKAGLIDRLPDLNLPVLILDGTRSPAIMSAVCAELQNRIPGAERLRIEGAGHMLPITHPCPAADRIAEFLKLCPIRE